VRWRQGVAGWPQQWVAEHVARAFTETYGGPELWQRLARSDGPGS
jgi:hypothetical protein